MNGNNQSAEITALNEKLYFLERKCGDLENKSRSLEHELYLLKNSRSWRYTKPIRWVKEKLVTYRTHTKVRKNKAFHNNASHKGTIADDLCLGSSCYEHYLIPQIVDCDRAAVFEFSMCHITKCNKENKKIDHIVVLPFLGSGGAERYALNFVDSLGRCNNEFVLLIVSDSKFVDRNVQLPKNCFLLVLEEHIRSQDYRRKVFLLFDLIRSIKPKTIHGVNSECFWYMVAANGVNVRGFGKLIGSIFCFQFDENKKRIGYSETFLKRCIPYLDILLSDNKTFQDEAKTAYALSDDDQNKMKVLYNYPRVDLQSRVLPEERINQKKRMTVLWAGRLDKQKRVDLLSDVIKASPFADFYIYGKSVIGDGSELPILPNMKYMGGFSHPNEFFKTGAYDAFVFTTKEEGMPNMLLEIGSYGIPIIAPDIGGIKELINAKTGILLNSEATADEYYRALLRIKTNPNDAAQRAEELLKVIKSRHSVEKYDISLKELICN